MTYDGIDNVRSKGNIGSYLYGNQCGTSTNAGPHAVCRTGATNYYYDKNGNLVSDSSGRSLQYTIYDLPSLILKGGHRTQFFYDPNRARYKRVDRTSTNQTTTTLSIGSVEKVYYPDGTVEWKRNIAGVGQITQTLNNQGEITGNAQRYFIKDHLGSISLITDEIGSVEQANYFDPWGMERKIITAASIKQWLADNANFRMVNKPITTRGFTGHEHLAEVGLIHMNGRIYDANIARFVQADPIIQDPLRVQSLNRYSYVWNNPLNATDPSGFECVDVGHHDKKCTPTNDDKVEEVKVEGSKQPASQRNSGFSYTITNPAAVQQWLNDNKLSMENFESMMKDRGISKASGSNQARAGSGALLADGKGNVVGAEFEEKNGTAIYALGEFSAAAEEVVGDGAQKGPVGEALGYLNKSKAFRDKYTEFLKTGAGIQITDEASSFDADSNTVFWNPTDANVHENGINSTALTLSHEIGHAVRFAENPAAFMKETQWPYYNGSYHVSQEEYRNLPFEQTVARQLGEPVRPEYLGVTGRTVGSPIFSCFSGSQGCN